METSFMETSFSVTPSFVVPSVVKSNDQLQLKSTWDARKLRHLLQGLQDPRNKTIVFEKIEALPEALLVELIQKLHTMQRRACQVGAKVLPRIVYFDLTQQLASAELRHGFEKNLYSLGDIPKLNALNHLKDKALYSWIHKRRPLQNSRAVALPSELWGKISSFLNFSDTLTQLKVSPQNSSDRFLLEAFKGKEDLLAEKWAKKLCESYSKTAIDNLQIKLPPTLEAVKANVRTLNLSGLTLTPFLLKSIALLLPNIEELNIKESKLDAECIKALASFPKLKMLSIHAKRPPLSGSINPPPLENKLTDEDFQHLRDCKRLEKLHLDLYSTTITGSFFSELSTTLKELICESCYRLNDKAIEGLKNKTQLQRLIFKYCSTITGNNFELLPTSLKEFECDCKDLTDSAINGLQNKTQLERLKLSSWHITGVNFDLLPPSLKELDCSYCQALTNSAISGLQNKIQLELFKVALSKHITGENFYALSTSLKTLEVTGANLSDTALKGLQDKFRLEKLKISGSSITGMTFDSLPPSLKELDCLDCSLCDEAIEKLRDKTQLEILKFSGSYCRPHFPGPSFTGKNLGALPLSLKELEMRTFDLNDNAIIGLQNKTNLIKLRLRDCVNITGVYFSALPFSLKELECKHCYRLTDSALAGLKNKTQLEVLKISRKTNITGVSFHDLPPSLKVLEFEGEHDFPRDSQLSDEALKGLQNLILLQVLKLSNHPFITGKNFDILPSTLQKVDFSNSRSVNDLAVQGLENKPELKNLNLSGTLVTGQYFENLSATLTDLICSSCKNLDDRALYNLQYQTKLDGLDISYTEVSARFAQFLPNSLKRFSYRNNRATDHPPTEEFKKFSHERGLSEFSDMWS
jgi:hypothetical protein